MKYEKTDNSTLQFSSRYQVAFNDAHAVEEATFFLKNRAKGQWNQQGSTIFLRELDDAFYVRLLFGEGIKLLREAGNYSPAPNDLT